MAGPTDIDFNLDTVSMTQLYPTFLAKYDRPSILADALGLESNDLSNQYPIQVLSSGAPYIIVPLVSLKAVQKTVPRRREILEILSDMESNGVVVFCTETNYSNSNLHTRMFAPGLGVAEDPATGSAAGPLGAYVEEYEAISNHNLGTNILIEQGYEMGRPSLLRSSVVRSESSHVRVGGIVRKTTEGHFFLQSDEHKESTS
jgi:trans-2,3-dihydro-3-hydroxyanthranilate isomerase